MCLGREFISNHFRALSPVLAYSRCARDNLHGAGHVLGAGANFLLHLHAQLARLLGAVVEHAREGCHGHALQPVLHAEVEPPADVLQGLAASPGVEWEVKGSVLDIDKSCPTQQVLGVRRHHGLPGSVMSGVQVADPRMELGIVRQALIEAFGVIIDLYVLNEARTRYQRPRKELLAGAGRRSVSRTYV